MYQTQPQQQNDLSMGDNDSFKFSGDILDTDDVFGWEGRLNFDFYIHVLVMKSIYALSAPNAEHGFFQFIVIIEDLESLAKACGRLSSEYDPLIEEYKKSPEYLRETKKAVSQDLKLAIKKKYYIMNELYKGKGITESLKIRFPQKLELGTNKENECLLPVEGEGPAVSGDGNNKQ